MKRGRFKLGLGLCDGIYRQCNAWVASLNYDIEMQSAECALKSTRTTRSEQLRSSHRQVNIDVSSVRVLRGSIERFTLGPYNLCLVSEVVRGFWAVGPIAELKRTRERETGEVLCCVWTGTGYRMSSGPGVRQLAEARLLSETWLSYVRTLKCRGLCRVWVSATLVTESSPYLIDPNFSWG